MTRSMLLGWIFVGAVVGVVVADASRLSPLVSRTMTWLLLDLL